MKLNLLLSITISIFLLCFLHSFAEVPQMINYQGKLTTPEGALIDTTIPMTFAIYTDSIGTDSLWSETQTSVVLEKGIFSEGSFNNVGYQLLANGYFDEAIEIFKINVNAYPSSANTYDSLAEAYMRSGNYTLAKRFYQMVYEKLPGDINIGPTFKQILLRSAEQNLKELQKLSTRP